jgi:drug/metabolite transporter (DMT)-like permease
VTLRWRGIPPWGNRRRMLLLRGLLGCGGLFSFYYAVMHLPLAEATVLHFVSPIFTAMLAPFLLREATGGRVWLAAVVGFAGVWLVAHGATDGGGSSDGFAVAVGLCGALFSACAYMTVRRAAATDHPLVIVFYFPLVAVPVTAPFAFVDFVMPQGIEWLWLLLVGVTTQLGQVCLTRGLAAVPAARATSIGYVQILFAMGWGLVVFGDCPAWTALGGAGLVVAGAWLAR